TQSGTDARKGAGAIVVMRNARHHGGQHRGVGSAERIGSDQLRDEQRMVDADEPGPFAVIGQMCRRREVPELLQDVDLLLETVPEACTQCLNRFEVALLFLAKFGRARIVSLTGSPRRTGWEI